MQILKPKDASHIAGNPSHWKGSSIEEKRIALVTGANKGIGLEIARQLAETGVTVIIGSRDAGRGEATVANLSAQGLATTSVQLDVADQASIAAAAAAIEASHGRLDILVNNAGIFDFTDAAPSSASIPAVRKVLETNFIGALADSQAMLPLLRSSAADRQPFKLAGLAERELRPIITLFRTALYWLQCLESGAQHADDPARRRAARHRHRRQFRQSGLCQNDLTGYGVMTPAEGARLPVLHALGGTDNGRFIEPDGYTPW